MTDASPVILKAQGETGVPLQAAADPVAVQDVKLDEAAGVAEFSFAPLEPLLRKREESGRFGAGECDIKKPAFLF